MTISESECREEDRIREENYQNKLGDELGYNRESCINCGRCRVLEYSNGYRFCEKCGTNQDTGKYDPDYDEFYFV